MEPNIENIKLWVEALRSGKYKQAQKALANEDGHCCLGVACDTFLINTGIGKWLPAEEERMAFATPSFDQGTESYMPAEVQEWLGLPNDPPLPFLNEGDMESQEYASELNDVKECDFNQIADAIEKKYLKDPA